MRFGAVASVWWFSQFWFWLWTFPKWHTAGFSVWLGLLNILSSGYEEWGWGRFLLFHLFIFCIHRINYNFVLDFHSRHLLHAAVSLLLPFFCRKTHLEHHRLRPVLLWYTVNSSSSLFLCVKQHNHAVMSNVTSSLTYFMCV